MTVADRSRVSLDGTSMVVDLSRVVWRPVALQRAQIDQGAEVGEQSLANESVWRRQRRTFDEGAGQDFADEADSNDKRFRSSRGVDCWEPRELSLLPTLKKTKNSTTGMGSVLAVNNRLVFSDTTSIYSTADPEAASPSFTTIASPGSPNLVTASQLTSDGRRIWFAPTNDGIYEASSPTDTSPSQIVTSATQNCNDFLSYANGRLLGGHDGELFEVRDGGATITSVFTHPAGSSFDWGGAVGTPNGIYAYGTIGSDSEVYLLTTDDATGALASIAWAVSLPPDEAIRDMIFYAGVMVLATTRGVRLAQIDGNGFLIYGPVIEVPGAGQGVSALHAHDRFCWFHWSNYDDTYTGLGRLRLDQFIAPLTPAYATDVMLTQTGGEVRGIATFDGRRYFSVTGTNLGLWGEDTDLEASGTFDAGWVSYAIPESKTYAGIDVRHEPLPAGASIAVALVEQDATSTTVLTSDTTDAVGKAATVTGISGEMVRPVLTLNRATDTTDGPVVRRWTLRSIPVPFYSEEIILPVINETTEVDRVPIAVDPSAQWQRLRTLAQSRDLVTFIFGDFSATVYVDGVGISGDEDEDALGERRWSDDGTWPTGTIAVRLKTVAVT